MPLIIFLFISILFCAITGVKLDKVFTAIYSHQPFNFKQTEQGKKNLDYAINAHNIRALSEQAHLKAQQSCHAQSRSYTDNGNKVSIKYKYKGQEKSCYSTTTTITVDGIKTEQTSLAYKIDSLPEYPIK